LSSLIKLEELILPRNQISDLLPLKSLSKLRKLVLSFNRINDTTPLASLARLEVLSLHFNGIRDLTPLIGLCHLRELDLRNNPLDTEAYCLDLHEIAVNNSFASIYYSDNAQTPTVISATDGLYTDRIEIAWEPVCNGPFYSTYYQVSRAPSARPDLRIEIGPWQTELVYIDTNVPAGDIYQYWIRASSSPQGHPAGPYSDVDLGWAGERRLLFVNDDADSDPGPGDALISDPSEQGSVFHPFDSIQEAIQSATSGTTIHVAHGYYPETLNFQGKDVHLIGSDPNHPQRLLWPVIDGVGDGPVLGFQGGEDPNCIIEGFTITGGQAPSAAAIDCWASHPTFKNCLIVSITINTSTSSHI